MPLTYHAFMSLIYDSYQLLIGAHYRKTYKNTIARRPPSTVQSTKSLPSQAQVPERTSQPPQTGTVIGLFCTAVLDIMLL